VEVEHWSGEHIGPCDLLRKSTSSNFDPKDAIFLGDVAYCERSLQTFNAVSGDQLYRYYR
jgi:hypothetical protein